MHRFIRAFSPLLLLSGSIHAAEFVYLGQIDDRGTPANGRYDLRIAAFGDEKSAAELMAPITFGAIEVKDGRFELRFDAALASARETWLEVAVRDAGAGDFATIPGRSKAIRAPLIGACWSSTGDAGTTGSNFLGTTDAQPLVLRTANVQSLRIEPSAQTFGGSPITANVISGSSVNGVTAGVRGATIAGGGIPTGDSDPAMIFEDPNRVTDSYGAIGGGWGNRTGNDDGDPLSHVADTVAGGVANVASGSTTSVGGGLRNTASGWYGTVAGGVTNTASGTSSSVAGGDGNCAGGDYSFAGGRYAKARPGSDSGPDGYGCAGIPRSGDANGDAGTFVWGAGTGADFISTGDNQFLVRAQGGMALNAPPPHGDIELTITADADGADYANLWLKPRAASNRGILLTAGDGSGANDAGFYIDHYNGSTMSRRVELANNGTVTVRSNITGSASGVAMAAGAGSWSSLSDRSVKTAIRPIDARAVLDRVLALPVTSWSYAAQDASIRHIGPMAQDFRAQFAIGENDTTISSVDADGVALAAIQGLNAKLETENAAKDAQITSLRARLQALESRLDALADKTH
ncbi:MAG: tail fiber domain-containing protein [Xanthomonadales bacterium]|nr:tail fiber domain-containing protein [Xanthomonadales bacterium]